MIEVVLRLARLGGRLADAEYWEEQVQLGDLPCRGAVSRSSSHET